MSNGKAVHPSLSTELLSKYYAFIPLIDNAVFSKIQIDEWLGTYSGRQLFFVDADDVAGLKARRTRQCKLISVPHSGGQTDWSPESLSEIPARIDSINP